MPQLSEQGYLYAAGKVLEYQYCAGSSTGKPTIVLLHEGLGCCAMWRKFPTQLNAATGLAVFGYSRAGYGRSGAGRLPWPVSYMHDEALEVLPQVLSAAGVGSAVLVGHSDGASIATIYAGGLKQNAACGLVLMAPHFFVEDISIKSIAKARRAFDSGALRSSLEKYHGPNTTEAFNGWNGAWLNPKFRKWNITSYLPKIAVPVLALQGADDEYGTGAQLAALEVECAAPIKLELIEECGHAPYRDQPALTTKVVADFIAQLAENGI